MSTIQPLTKQALNHHALQYDKHSRTSNAATGTSSGTAAAAAAHPGMSESKLELVLNYIENQINISQGSLPMTDASREFIRKTNSKCAQKAAGQPNHIADAETGEAGESTSQPQQLNRRKREKRTSLRKHMYNPANSSHNDASAATAGLAAGSGTNFFGAIQVQPSKQKEPKRHLGIFNKGKAVASKSSGIAFSESEFLNNANVCRIQMEGAPGDNTNGECSRPARHISRRYSNDDGTYSGTSQPLTKEPFVPKSFSHWKDIDPTIQHARASGSSRRPPCPNVVSARDNSTHTPSVPGRSIAAYPEEPIVFPLSSQSPCSEVMHCESDAHDFISASIDSVPLDPDTQTADVNFPGNVINGGGCGPRPQNTAPTRQSRAKLLESIEEYLSLDDKYGSLTPRGLSLGLTSGGAAADSDCLDISALFDEHNDHGTPRFSDSRSISITALSELGDSIFASGDIQSMRHPGNIAISDFGNSRYGPGFHGLDLYALSGQSRDNIESMDTLPEYAFREELPPPYLSFEETPRISREYDRYNMHQSAFPWAPINRPSPPHTLVRQRPSSWRGYSNNEVHSLDRPCVDAGGYDHSRLHRSNSTNHRARPPVVSGSMRSTNQEEFDFRVYPWNTS